MTIYAIKNPDGPDGKDRVQQIFDSLKKGESRFGWSFVETADMRELKQRVQQHGWDHLTAEEAECYHEFLLEVKPNDYVVHINVPEWGYCTLARVTGEYEFRYEDDDFNHRLKVDPESVIPFNRNDAKVPNYLSARLKLRGRWWHVYAEEEFKQLLAALDQTREYEPKDRSDELWRLAEEVLPLLGQISEKIHHTHPNTRLEALMEDVLKRVPGVTAVRRQGGRSDHGADLLVRFENEYPIPGLVSQEILVVQVKSFTGDHIVAGAVDDIKRAFDHYNGSEDRELATMGLIVSTAENPGEELRERLDQLQEDSGKPVSLLIGADLAAFVLRFGGELLRR